MAAWAISHSKLLKFEVPDDAEVDYSFHVILFSVACLPRPQESPCLISMVVPVGFSFSPGHLICSFFVSNMQ
jgi:hypothetical protein